jgi:Ribosomal protein L9, N-terminal domain
MYTPPLPRSLFVLSSASLTHAGLCNETTVVLQASGALLPVRGKRKLSSDKTFEVILLEDLWGRGVRGQVVRVRKGFARNFLLPNNKAVYGTPENRRAYALPPDVRARCFFFFLS